MKDSINNSSKSWAKHSLTITTLCIVIGLFIFVGFNLPKESNTAYVSSGTLFEKFELRQQLETEFQNDMNARKAVLDSLQLQLSTMAQQLEQQPSPSQEQVELFQYKRETFFRAQQLFEEENEQKYAQFQEQVWTQLNQYVSDFGTENNLDYIFGANGNGSIMHASPENDITDQVVQYANQKFKGQ